MLMPEEVKSPGETLHQIQKFRPCGREVAIGLASRAWREVAELGVA